MTRLPIPLRPEVPLRPGCVLGSISGRLERRGVEIGAVLILPDPSRDLEAVGHLQFERDRSLTYDRRVDRENGGRVVLGRETKAQRVHGRHGTRGGPGQRREAAKTQPMSGSLPCRPPPVRTASRGPRQTRSRGRPRRGPAGRRPRPRTLRGDRCARRARRRRARRRPRGTSSSRGRSRSRGSTSPRRGGPRSRRRRARGRPGPPWPDSLGRGRRRRSRPWPGGTGGRGRGLAALELPRVGQVDHEERLGSSIRVPSASRGTIRTSTRGAPGTTLTVGIGSPGPTWTELGRTE